MGSICSCWSLKKIDIIDSNTATFFQHQRDWFDLFQDQIDRSITQKTIDSIKRQMIEFSTLPEYDIIPQRVDKKFTKTRLPWISKSISRGYHTPGSQFFYLKFEKLQELLQNLKQNRKYLNSLVSCPGKFTSWKN